MIKNWIDVHEDELSLFLWSMILLFLIRSSGIIFSNFTETAFLKRYGVEYLPVVYMLNSIITFVVMGFLAGIIARLEGNQILAYVLLFCSCSVAALRIIVPYDFNFLYPLLFILKAQYDILLGLLFWNLANDLFNIRQSKRLFPLVIAGGVIGEIIGSFGTPILGELISINNLMLAYAINTMLAFFTITKMRYRFPTLLFTAGKGKKAQSRPSVTEQFQNIRVLIGETPLVTILILLTLLPNIVIPILNYQFNFTINSQFATETGMIQFFGYFRGVMNIVSLVLLLFVGKVYSRLGLPIALMFHPFNYLLVFTAFLFRFDVFSAIYARLSTNVIRTTFNKPVTDVLMGIFPTSYRSKIRPFLRGTVVRIGLFTGSGIILLSEGLFPPQYLSLAVFPVVIAWILTTFYLKKNYSTILSGLLSKDMLDIKSIEDQDVGHLFKDVGTQDVLVQTFLSAKGEDALWYARLLLSLSTPDLDTHIISTLKDQDTGTKTELLELISDKADERDIRVLVKMADPKNQDVFIAVIKTLKRIRTDTRALISKEFMDTSQNPEVRAYAASCLYESEPEKLYNIVTSWLTSEDESKKRAGVIAAGGSEDPSHVSRLAKLLEHPEQDHLIPLILQAIHSLQPEGINECALAFLSHEKQPVRKAALDVIEINDDHTLMSVIPLLADRSDRIREKVKKKIQTASHQNGKLLIESLNMPQKKLREGIFSLLKSLEIKERDTFLFARTQIETTYVNLAILTAVKQFSGTTGKTLLKEHLEQKNHDNIESLFRVLSIKDVSGQFRIVFKSLFSKDTRQKANALELLDGILEPSLLKLLMPLLDETPPAKALEKGRKKLSLPIFNHDINQLYQFLLEGECWVSQILALYSIREEGLFDQYKDTIYKLTKTDHPILRQEALRINSENQTSKEDDMGTDISIQDKIIYLKKIGIFKKLSVNELAAIAAIAKKVVYSPGEFVFKENDIAETMYLIIDGELSLIKKDKQLPGRVFSAGETIGEAGLLLNEVRLLTLIAEAESTLLVIHKQEFLEIVREYPHISLEIAIAMAGQVQELLEQFVEEEDSSENSS